MNGARYSYLRRICELVEEGQDIVIVSEDYAAPMFDDFRVRHPKRFLNVGIAEQNGIAVACGLALAGKYPIVYGCAPFPLTRAIDQLKSAVAGMHLPMTIINSGVGFGVPEFGATHFNADDLALVRCVPGVKIITPTDNVMGKILADFSMNSDKPLYVRFDKNSEGQLYQPAEIDFEKGVYAVRGFAERADAIVISCGFMLQEMITLAERMKKDGLLLKVLDMYSIPFDVPAVLRECGSLPIITVEEHVLQGGLGSIMLEMVNTYHAKNPVIRLGIDFKDSYPSISGTREYFMEKYHLLIEDIALVVQKACRK